MTTEDKRAVRRIKSARDSSTVIYRHLREAILSGELKAGAPVAQLQIAREFGTSRGPVREALNRCMQEGLVVARKNQRMLVAELNVQELETLFSSLLLNTSFALRWGVPRYSEEDFATMEAYNAQLKGNHETPGPWESANRALIMRMSDHAGGRVRSVVTHLLGHIERYRRSLLADRLPIEYDLTYDGVLHAARARDADLATTRYVQVAGEYALSLLADVDEREPTMLRQYIEWLSLPAEEMPLITAKLAPQQI